MVAGDALGHALALALPPFWLLRHAFERAGFPLFGGTMAPPTHEDDVHHVAPDAAQGAQTHRGDPQEERARHTRLETERERFFSLSIDMLAYLDERGRLKEANPAWEATLGYSRDQLLALPFVSLVHPLDQGRMAGHFQRLLLGPPAASFELRMRTARGAYRWIAWNITPFLEEGLLYAIGRDVHDAKITERALREAGDELEKRVQERTAELKAINEELQSFTYIVSHDLRAPLVNLKGFASELRGAMLEAQSVLEPLLPGLAEPTRRVVADTFDKEAPEAFGFIDAAVTRMENLIAALLKLSRLGRREFNFELLDMNGLVQDVLDSLAHQIEQKQVGVYVGPLPWIVADRVSVEQIIGNLLSNAVLYLDPTRRGLIQINGEDTPTDTVFHVEDNGRGIAETDLPKVFEPFRRIGKPEVPGEGMGLAFVQTLVRRHGGRIVCKSELGAGTTFSFTISRRLSQGGQHEGTTTDDHPAGGG